MKVNFLESDSLSAKRVVIFGINRVQSVPTVTHVKEISRLYKEFKSLGIDDVYCVSFGDFCMFDQLMPKFSKDIKFIQNGSNETVEAFQQLLGKKGHPDFLKQYWQFACILNNNIVQYYIEQPFTKVKILADTREKIYSSVGPEVVLATLRGVSSVG